MPRKAKQAIQSEPIMEEPSSPSSEDRSPPKLKRQTGASKLVKAKPRKSLPAEDAVREMDAAPAKAPRKKSAWNEHVSKVRRENPDMAFADVIKLAKSQYKKAEK